MITHKSSEPLEHLRLVIENADYLINSAVYHETKCLFTTCLSNPQHLENLQRLAPEYGKAEFFLCVDSNGEPIAPTNDMIEDFRETATQSPDFKLWFREATLPEDERPPLLIARWLFHLVGFRHRSVHLFIDHPTLDNHTLVQVRGLDKFDSPGCFDLPAAGHAVGLASAKDTVFKELGEELNLSRDDIYALEMVGGYDYCEPVSKLGFRNIEFRVVFRSLLKTHGLLKIRFVDCEVAAISLFTLSVLEALIKNFPERVASGLKGSFPLYLKSRSKLGNEL